MTSYTMSSEPEDKWLFVAVYQEENEFRRNEAKSTEFVEECS